MSDETPVPISSLPGIKRDGTRFDSDHYADGQWCRFQRNRPRKIGGHRSVTLTLPEVVYGMTSFSANAQQYLHMGGSSSLTQVIADDQGVLVNQFDRTPSALVNSANNLWQMDAFVDGVNGNPVLIAHAGQNLAAIDSTVETEIFYGDMTASGVLTDALTDPQSGGVVALAPYLLTFGNVGRVDIYDATFAQLDSAFVTGQKLVAGLPLRGASGPAGIFWSLNSVITATFTSSVLGYFAFNTVSAKSSVLSSRGIVEYDGVYYWAGVDRFMMFNGVVRELKNEMNQNYFFDGINYTYRQKVFAFIVPRFGEIWWCYPKGNATECTHAVIYNVNLGIWYDTALPALGRSSANFAEVYQKPFMTDITETDSGYGLWQQETGVDEVYGNLVRAIPSYFETSEISMLTSAKPESKTTRVAWLEPDFVQTGLMTVQTMGRANARANEQDGQVFSFNPPPVTADFQLIDLRELRRLMRFRFMSNVAGGNYQMGKTMVHLAAADGRATGP